MAKEVVSPIPHHAVPKGAIWAITTGDEDDHLVNVRRKSKHAIVVCSLIVVLVASFLAAWVFIVKPSFYPRIAVFSRDVDSVQIFSQPPMENIEPDHLSHRRKHRERRSIEDHSSNWEDLHRKRFRRTATPEKKVKALHVEEVTEVSDFPHKQARLPRHLTPMEYFIMLDLDQNKENFTGETEIKFNCSSSTTHVIFHGRRLEFHDLVLTPFSIDQELPYTRILYYKKFEMFSIELEEPLQKGRQYHLAIRYQASYSKGLAGLYRSAYKMENGERRNIVSSHFEPTDARSAIPCFDEPIFKAIFHVNIVHDKTYHALSNMPVIQKAPYPNDRTQTHFKPSVSMSTYLLAFAVVDFRFKETHTASGIRVRVYARAADYDRIDYACTTAATVIAFYEGYFGVPYPLPKLDLLAVPDFLAGAMEDWGLVSFRSAYLIYDPKLVTTEMQKVVTLVIAHELAHQWFGNLVTMKWWNDIWLNEGFANFVEMLGTGVVNPNFYALDLQVSTGWQSALSLDSLKNSHPISQPVTSSSEIDELFDSISYNKGAAVLRMLQSFLGNSFIEGVKIYINKHKFGNAETDDLWTALHKAEGSLNIKEIMDTWTRQRGFPIIQVERLPKQGRLIIKQKSILVAKDEAIAKRDKIEHKRSLWHIPFTFVSSVSPHKAKLAWIRKVPRIEVPVEPNASWVKANVDSRGFYVVNYDNKTWANLIKQLRNNHSVIPPVDRASLIHDALKLSCDLIINPLISLELMRYLKKEKEYIPWAMTRAKFDCISNVIKNKTVKKLYKKYVWSLQEHLIDPDFTNSSMKKARDPVDLFQQYEAHSYAMRYGLRKDIKQKLRDLFVKYKKGVSVPHATPELRALALTYGFNIKDDGDLDFIWHLYVNAEVDSDRRVLMRTFSQFKDKKKLGKVLNNSLDLAKVRAQDTIPLLLSIVKIGGRAQVWDFIVANFPVFRERYGGGYQLGSLLSEVAGGFMSRKDLDRVKKFLASNSIGKKGSRTEKQIIEKIENNLKRHSGSKPNKERSKLIEDWVQRHMGAKSTKDEEQDKGQNKDKEEDNGIWF